MPPGSNKATPTFQQQRTLLVAHMQREGITQTELANMIGRSVKHVSQVLNGHAGTSELDYWAWVLGLEYTVQLVDRNGVTDG